LGQDKKETGSQVKLLALFSLSLCLSAAKKDRDWQPGKVLDSRTVETGSRAVNAYPEVPYGPPSPVVARITTTAELKILGAVYSYAVRDLGDMGVLVRHPCRYIVGDPVKYVQAKSLMYLIDADGKECRGQIMAQVRTDAEAK
jgi:hypothetical protein